MSLVIGLGSNLGDKVQNLEQALELLSEKFILMARSRIYLSQAVEYTEQPDFVNMVAQFELPEISASDVLSFLLEIEKLMGRQRLILKGPRMIDLDLLFYGTSSILLDHLEVPHPRLFDRSFVVLPLRELPCFETLKKKFSFKEQFSSWAKPID